MVIDIDVPLLSPSPASEVSTPRLNARYWRDFTLFKIGSKRCHQIEFGHNGLLRLSMS